MNIDSKILNDDLNTFVIAHSDTIARKAGYYDFIYNPTISFLAAKSLSADNQTMVFTISFQKETNLVKIIKTVGDLLSFAQKHSTSELYVGCTGLQPLFAELTAGSTIAFELIDAVVLPIAILILGYNLRSYRHMLIAIMNLGCTILFAFALLVPVTTVEIINPFAPSIMLSLGIAVCFDYTLFMLSRFREEIIVNKKSKEESVLSCLIASGHVVMLSGTTLFATFIVLVTFPQNFLQSVGTGCSTVVFTAVLSNMTLTPCLLLTFDCLSKFDMFPTLECCCCCFYRSEKKQASLKLDHTVQKELDDSSHSKLKNTTGNNISNIDLDSIRGQRLDTVMPKEIQTDDEEILSDSLLAICSDPTIPVIKKSPRQFWFHIVYFVTKYSYFTILVAAAITIPFAQEFLKMVSY